MQRLEPFFSALSAPRSSASSLRGVWVLPLGVGAGAACFALMMRDAPSDWGFVHEAIAQSPRDWYRDPGTQMGPLTLALAWVVHNQLAWVCLGGALLGVFVWAAGLNLPIAVLALSPWLEVASRAHVDDLLVMIAAAGMLTRSRPGWWFCCGVAAKPTCLALAPILPLPTVAWTVSLATVVYAPFMPDVLHAGRGGYPVSVATPLRLIAPVGSTMPPWVRPLQLACGWLVGLALRPQVALIPVGAFTVREWLEPVPWAYHGAVVALAALLSRRPLVVAPAFALFISCYAGVGLWRLLILGLISTCIVVEWRRVDGGGPVASHDA